MAEAAAEAEAQAAAALRAKTQPISTPSRPDGSKGSDV
jgi:hypothetical protein